MFNYFRFAYGQNDTVKSPTLTFTASYSVVTPDTCTCAEPVMDFVEEMPSFPGGQEAWNNYLDTAIRINSDVTGTVYVGFEVQANGEICNVVVKKGIPNAFFLNTEAVRVMRNSPNWNPGKMNGRAVCVHLNLPIKFD